MTITPALERGQVGSSAINKALVDAVTLDTFSVATLPVAADHADKMIVVSDGNAGAKCLAFSDGVNWLRIVFGAAVAAV